MSDNQLAVMPSLAPSTMEQALAFAEQMSQARLLPAHLQKSPADCLRVVLQSVRWQMDPFAVADKTSIIQGKLMYEGQLVSAVVNARGNLSKRLDYSFKGEGDARVLTVSGTVKGETEPRVIELPFSLARKINRNGQMNINPDQQATYIGARMWARRHMPELMLGVYTPDEIDDPENPDATTPQDVTPPAQRPAPKPRAPKGAAAAKVVDTEVVIEQPKVVGIPKVVETPKAEAPKPAEVVAPPAEPVKEPEPVQEAPKPVEPPKKVESFADAAAATEAIVQRALLHDGETITVTASIDAFKVVTGTREGKPHLYVTADITSPELKGQVSQTDGGIENGQPKAVWQLEKAVKMKVRGKKFKSGALMNIVDSIWMAEGENEI